jgi:hypothetical protein
MTSELLVGSTQLRPTIANDVSRGAPNSSSRKLAAVDRFMKL